MIEQGRIEALTCVNVRDAAHAIFVQRLATMSRRCASGSASRRAARDVLAQTCRLSFAHGASRPATAIIGKLAAIE